MTKKNGVVSNLAWKFAERISAQVVTLVVSIVLARLLDPSHYGIVAMVTVFITIANVFVQDGFGSALIQKKNADELDFSSVLILSVGLSILLYWLLFFAAPFISSFYGEGYEQLTPVLRVLSLRLILSAINSVQQAYVSRKMIFKKFFWATLLGTITSAIVGIWMAYCGFGVWALVAQYLTNTTIDTIILQISLNKWPKLKFSFERVRGLFGYGWKILGASLLNNGYQELRTLLIGKIYTSSDLAYYSKGKQFPELLVININTSIGSVMFPKMSKEQDDISKLKETTRQSIRFSSYVLSPMMFGLAAVATPFISLLLTDKWLFAVPLMQLYCIFYLAQPIHTANMQAIKALGRSDTFFKLEIIKKTIELITLLAVMKISVLAIAISATALNWLFIFVNSYPNNKLLHYSVKEQIKDIFPPIAMGLVMAGVVLLCGKLELPQLPLMIIQVIVGVVVYTGLSLLLKNKEFTYLFNMIKRFVRRTA